MIDDYTPPPIVIQEIQQSLIGLPCIISEKPHVFSPAEFNLQDSIWLSWCWGGAKKGHPYYSISLDIIALIPLTESIHIICQSISDVEEIKRLILQRIKSTDHITFHTFGSSTIWIRDTGPSFVKTAAGQLQLAQFSFNDWGYEEESTSDDVLVPPNIARSIGLPIHKTFLISEGGNREINGKGTLITVASVEEQRNPHFERKEMQSQYREMLGIHKVIWLEKGLYEDDQTTIQPLPNAQGNPTYYTTFNPGGHIDEFCRFVDENTVLLAQIPYDQLDHPIHKENAKRLEQNYKILSNSTDQDGQPLKIIRVPTGPMLFDVFEEGDTFYSYFNEHRFTPSVFFPKGKFPCLKAFPIIVPTSYLNYLVINETVIISQYWKSGMPEAIKKTDMQIFQLFSELYPDKTIYVLNPYHVNLAGGGIHCMTLNQPK